MLLVIAKPAGTVFQHCIQDLKPTVQIEKEHPSSPAAEKRVKTGSCGQVQFMSFAGRQAHVRSKLDCAIHDQLGQARGFCCSCRREGRGDETDDSRDTCVWQH